MQFLARPCELSEVQEIYREVFIQEKGWPAEDLINRPDGRNFILFAGDEPAGGMKIILKQEAKAPLMFEQEFYEIPKDAGEIAIVALKKGYRGVGGLKYLFREFYRFAHQYGVFQYYAIVDPKVNTIFSLFGFEMDSKAKEIWGELCNSGTYNMISAMAQISVTSPTIHRFLST